MQPFAGPGFVRPARIMFVGATISNLATLSYPAGIQSNDKAFVWDVAKAIGGSPPASVTPTLFSQISTANDGTSLRCNISHKTLSGSETSITGMDGGDPNNGATNAKIMMVMRPYTGGVWQAPVSSFITLSPSGSANIGSGAGVTPLVAFGALYSGHPASLVMSPAYRDHSAVTVLGGSPNTLDVGYLVQDAAPQDINVGDFTGFSAALMSAGFYCAVV